MTKADIIAKISTTSNLPKKEATALLETFIDILKTQLETGEGIRISGFGNFTVNQKTARRGRNPQTGEAITIKARRVISFKPSASLRDTLNKAP